MMLCLAIGFTGCGKDDDKDEPKPDVQQQASLVGTWVRTYSETEDGLIYKFEDKLVFNSDGTGYNTETTSISNRAGVSQTETDNFLWNESTTADNIRYVEIIHTGGDKIIDNGRFTFTLIGNKLNIFGVVYNRQ